MVETKNIAVIGLGYVGLPLATEFVKKHNVIGFDLDTDRVNQLRKGIDITKELSQEGLLNLSKIKITEDQNDLNNIDYYICTVPTPVDKKNIPKLDYLISASEIIGKNIKQNSIIIYESTVYPGLLEEVCVPLLEKFSGKKLNNDFYVGYSPERINPGDKNHSLRNIIKVVSGSNPYALEKVAELYNDVIDAGVYQANSIKVAEAAKVIENIQRDINIALINELSIIFEKIGIDTNEVLDAACTKWNFSNFRPGLVGGHCIGVDPYYLTYKAEQIGIYPKIILSGREINEGVSSRVALKAAELLKAKGNKNLKNLNCLILGITFKENCPDTRNSKVFNLASEIKKLGLKIEVYDPIAGIIDQNLTCLDEFPDKTYDLIILSVPHQSIIDLGLNKIKRNLSKNGVFIDLKAAFPSEASDFRL